MKTHIHLPAVFILLFLLAPAAWAQTFSLGTTNLLEGPAAGSDSVVLVAGSAWTATANAAWLHLNTANQSGANSTNVIFSFDANPGTTRTDTLTIAGETVIITQAGSTYIPISNLTTLVSSGLNSPRGITLDSAGNVYIADFNNSAIKVWTTANRTVTTMVSGLNSPYGIAFDSASNGYIASWFGHAIMKWTAANSNLTTLVSLNTSVYPSDVTVDGAGNVYFTDYSSGSMDMWIAASNAVTTLVSSLHHPISLALDAANNIYITDSYNVAIKKWTAANSNVNTVLTSGLSLPYGVAVDGGGNVYTTDAINNDIKKWTAANNTVTTLVSSNLLTPKGQLWGIAVYSAGNVYFSDQGNNVVKEFFSIFMDPTSKTETSASGKDSLPAVLPTTANLTGSFAPTSDSSWLTITSVTNGIVSYEFTTNYSATRTAHINLLGQSIAIVQMSPSIFLGTTNLLEGPAAGSDSVVLSVTPKNTPWTATTNATWLHLSAANQSGANSTNVIFSFDANTGTTRTSSLTIAGWSLTITQAGSTNFATSNATMLVSSGLNLPCGIAVDDAGNVYFSDTYNNAIKKWTATNNTITALVTSGLSTPIGVAVDGVGNVYIADQVNNAIKKWSKVNSNVTTLVSSGLNLPHGVAVDSMGNVYIADSGNNSIKEWIAASNTVITLISSGLSNPYSVAVDYAGNVYIGDNLNNAIKELKLVNYTVTTLVSSGLSGPRGVAVDGSGNVYIADCTNNAIKKWIAASNAITTLISSNSVTPLNQPRGVVVDGAGNVYIADSGNNAIKEIPHAFVLFTFKREPTISGSDSLPVVLPATANLTGPFTPTSDSSWLTISGCNNGVVGFAFNANYFTTNRTGHVTVLGKSIAVTQSGITQPATVQPGLTGCKIMGNGSLQFAFTNNQGASFTVWTSTNMLLPFTNWTPLGALTNDGSGQYQFNDPSVTNGDQRFYRVSSP